MKLLKMYKDNFGKWEETTFEKEEHILKDHYTDIEVVKEALKRGDVVGTTFSMYKIPMSEIKKKERR